MRDRDDDGIVFLYCRYMFTYAFHYTTLHYIALHYITLHYITLHYITLHYITLHYITLHYIVRCPLTYQYHCISALRIVRGSTKNLELIK